MNQPPSLKLTGDERAALRDLVLSEAWKTLTEKVWQPYIDFYREVCATCVNDHRHAQGIYRGFAFAAQIALASSMPESEVEQFVAVTEADLMARRRTPTGY